MNEETNPSKILGDAFQAAFPGETKIPGVSALVIAWTPNEPDSTEGKLACGVHGSISEIANVLCNAAAQSDDIKQTIILAAMILTITGESPSGGLGGLLETVLSSRGQAS